MSRRRTPIDAQGSPPKPKMFELQLAAPISQHEMPRRPPSAAALHLRCAARAAPDVSAAVDTPSVSDSSERCVSTRNVRNEFRDAVGDTMRLSANVDSLSMKLHSAVEQKNAMELQLKKVCAALRSEKASAHISIGALRADLQRQQAQSSQREAAWEQSQKDVASLRVQNATLEKAVAAQISVSQKHKADMEALVLENAELQSAAASSKRVDIGELDAANKRIDEHVVALEKMTKEKDALQESLELSRTNVNANAGLEPRREPVITGALTAPDAAPSGIRVNGTARVAKTGVSHAVDSFDAHTLSLDSLASMGSETPIASQASTAETSAAYGAALVADLKDRFGEAAHEYERAARRACAAIGTDVHQ